MSGEYHGNGIHTVEGGHVLLTDDDEGLRIVLSIALRGKGFAVDVAANSTEALQKFREGHYDWVITDIDMPGMNGLELVKQVKEIVPSVRVIVITGSGPPPDPRLLRVEGIFEKPIDARKMAHYLRNFGYHDKRN